jgi:hypothetical protein
MITIAYKPSFSFMYCLSISFILLSSTDEVALSGLSLASLKKEFTEQLALYLIYLLDGMDI